MLIVRGTKKLRDRVRAVPATGGDASTTVLGDWFANALFWRPQVALLVNRRTLLPVFMPLAPAATVLDRAPDAIASVLRRHGVPDDVVAAEREAMLDVRIAPTDDRSVLGVMNEFAALGEHLASFPESDLDLEELSMHLSEMFLRPLPTTTGTPDRALAAVFDLEVPAPLAKVVPFPGPPRGSTVYQLRIDLIGIDPPVWRRVLVDAGQTLDHLHDVIQAAFSWWNCHLHEFEVGDARFGCPDPDWDDEPPGDERSVRLDAIAGEGDTFRYLYDFGDDWEHQVTVERVFPSADGPPVPACVDGARACPPEDCGGPWGYQDLLGTLADPDHPGRAALLQWIGRPFDPETFDPADFEANLRTARLASLDD